MHRIHQLGSLSSQYGQPEQNQNKTFSELLKHALQFFEGLLMAFAMSLKLLSVNCAPLTGGKISGDVF